MYIRMTDGRERGQVVDMVEDVGRAMLANGQAVPVDFSEPDPLGAREIAGIPLVATDLVPPGKVALVEVRDPQIQNPQVSSARPGAPGIFHRKKR